MQIAPLFRPVQPSHRIRTPKAVAAATLPFILSLLSAPCAAYSDWVPFVDCTFGFLTCGTMLLLVNKWTVHYTFAPATVAACQSFPLSPPASGMVKYDAPAAKRGNSKCKMRKNGVLPP